MNQLSPEQPPRSAQIFQRLDQVDPAPYSFSEYARRILWNIANVAVFQLPIPRAYGLRCSILRLFGAKIGNGSGVHRSARIVHPWLLEMGQCSMIGPHVRVYNLGPISIGDHTIVSQDVHLCAGTHDYNQRALPLLRPPIKIGSGVWIAADAFIGPGVTIGDNVVVGARAVVVKDVPNHAIVAGNPARVIRQRSAAMR